MAPLISLVVLSASLVPLASHSLGMMRCETAPITSSENHHPEKKSHFPPETPCTQWSAMSAASSSNCETTIHCICTETPVATSAPQIENHRVSPDQNQLAVKIPRCTFGLETHLSFIRKNSWKQNYSPPPYFIRFQNLLIWYYCPFWDYSVVFNFKSIFLRWKLIIYTLLRCFLSAP